jgi:hypothetical protein
MSGLRIGNNPSMSVQASPAQARKIASLALLGSIVWTLVAAIAAWLIWGTAIAVLVAVGFAGLSEFLVGIIVMAVSMMRTRYPLRDPDEVSKDD